MIFHRYNDPQRNDGLSLKIRLTNRCNFKCHYCFYRDNSSEFADLKRVIEFFKAMKDSYPYFYIYLHGGEPTLHPYFLSFIYELQDVLKGRDHFLYFDTNFSKPESFWDQFCDMVDPDKTKVNCTLHIDQNDIDRFTQKFDELKCTKQLNIMVESSTFDQCRDIFDSLNPEWNVVPKPIFNGIDELEYTNQQRRFFYDHDTTRQFCFDDKIFSLNQIELEGRNNFYGWKCEYGKKNIVIDVNGDMYYCVAHQLSIGKPFMNLNKNEIGKYFEIHKPSICLFQKCSACDLRIHKNNNS
jgi:sulfatase maturation enzyme AslB (radical SAM superfamily)